MSLSLKCPREQNVGIYNSEGLFSNMSLWDEYIHLPRKQFKNTLCNANEPVMFTLHEKDETLIVRVTSLMT